jgi:hypothetical protein
VREIRLHGSEGGGAENQLSLPLSTKPVPALWVDDEKNGGNWRFFEW